MKNILLLFLFAAHLTFAYGQISTRLGVIVRYPDNCESIKQFKDGKLLQVYEFDRTKKVVFNNYLESINAVYQKSNGAIDHIITVRYDNPLGGVQPTRLKIAIEYFNYDSKGKQSDSYTKVRLFEGLDTSVFKCSSREELTRDPKVLETLSSGIIKEKKITSYDLKGNIASEISLGSNGDTAVLKHYQYNEYNQITKATTELGSLLFNTGTYEYSNKLLTRTDQKSYGGTSSSNTQTFDANGLLKETRYYSNEQLRSSIKVDYTKSGRIKESQSFSGSSDIPRIKNSFYFDHKSSLKKSVFEDPDIKITSYYNSNELITKEISFDLQTKKKTTTNFTYEFGYF
jgi:hypothetical protein